MTENTTAPSVTFKTPLAYGQEELTGLTFRRLAAGDLRGLKLDGIQYVDTDLYLTIAARAATTHITPAHLDKLSATDVFAVVNAVVEIMTPSKPDDGADNAVPLDRPITRPEGDITHLRFREPVAGDLRGLRLTGLFSVEVDTLLTLAQRCSIDRVDAADLAGLDAADLSKIGTALMGFFV